MPLPPFTATGDLPPGIHRATLAEVLERFGTSVFWLRRLAMLDDEQTTLSHWQITREGYHRGIVEIIPELP